MDKNVLASVEIKDGMVIKENNCTAKIYPPDHCWTDKEMWYEIKVNDTVYHLTSYREFSNFMRLMDKLGQKTKVLYDPDEKFGLQKI